MYIFHFVVGLLLRFSLRETNVTFSSPIVFQHPFQFIYLNSLFSGIWLSTLLFLFHVIFYMLTTHLAYNLILPHKLSLAAIIILISHMITTVIWITSFLLHVLRFPFNTIVCSVIIDTFAVLSWFLYTYLPIFGNDFSYLKLLVL